MRHSGSQHLKGVLLRVLCFSGGAVSLALARERHGEARKLLAIGTDPRARNPAQDFRPSDTLKATRKTNYARIDEKELPHLLKEIEDDKAARFKTTVIKGFSRRS
jgi:hypothetical protein